MSEKELEYIEKVAKKIVETDFEGVAIFALQTLRPLYFIGGELATFFFAPYLYLLDEKGFEAIDVFEKRENIERLIKRVEELIKEKEKKSQKKKVPS